MHYGISVFGGERNRIAITVEVVCGDLNYGPNRPSAAFFGKIFESSVDFHRAFFVGKRNFTADLQARPRIDRAFGFNRIADFRDAETSAVENPVWRSRPLPVVVPPLRGDPNFLAAEVLPNAVPRIVALPVSDIFKRGIDEQKIMPVERKLHNATAKLGDDFYTKSVPVQLLELSGKTHLSSCAIL